MRSPVVRLVGICTILALSGLSGARAQTGTPVGCEDLLSEAERAYTEQEHGAVESLALNCVYRPGGTPSELQQAYRLLVLTYLKQGLLTEARLTAVKLLAADAAYQPDPMVEIPAYVALIDAVREQIRVPVDDPVPSAPALSVPTLSEPVPTEPVPTGPTGPPSEGLVDVNTAGADALDSVPGIGPAIASRIIEYREENGPFRSVDDLVEVRGIGARSVERMLPYLTAGDGSAVSLREDSPPGPAPEMPPSAPKINLNTASAEELDALPGIGPALAGRIVAFREGYGAFRSLDDVMLVRGIGPRVLEGFAALVTLD